MYLFYMLSIVNSLVFLYVSHVPIHYNIHTIPTVVNAPLLWLQQLLVHLVELATYLCPGAIIMRKDEILSHVFQLVLAWSSS